MMLMWMMMMISVDVDSDVDSVMSGGAGGAGGVDRVPDALGCEGGLDLTQL